MATEQQLRAAADATVLVYSHSREAVPDGYVWKADFNDDKTGAYGYLIVNPTTGHAIIAFAGSENPRDFNADTQLGLPQYEKIRNQVADALNTNLAGVTRLDFAGHSLGAALAQYFAYLAAGGKDNNVVLNPLAASIGLFTYNGLGGITGIGKIFAPDGGYDPTIAARIDATNVFAKNQDGLSDIVVRLDDGGHLGGNTRVFPLTTTGSMPVLGMHDVNVLMGVASFSTLQAGTPPYLHIQDGIDIAGLATKILHYDQTGDTANFATLMTAGVLTLAGATANDIEQLTQAFTGMNKGSFLASVGRDAVLVGAGVGAWAVMLRAKDVYDRFQDSKNTLPFAGDAFKPSYAVASNGLTIAIYPDGSTQTIKKAGGGVTIQWTYTDPLTKQVTDYTFANDGSVTYKLLDASNRPITTTQSTLLSTGEYYTSAADGIGNYLSGNLTYTAQTGDTQALVAAQMGISVSTLQSYNAGLSTDGSLAQGASLVIPVGNFGNTATPDNTKLTLGTHTAHTAPQALLPGAEQEGAATGLINAGYLFRATDSWTQMPIGILNGDGTWNTVPASIVSNDFRPGNFNLMHSGTQVVDADYAIQLAAQGMTLLDVAKTNNVYWDATGAIYVDPLVLDLDGDGVHLTDYGTNPVLFDIDNDGGSQELSGWVSPQDGLLVMDRNGNGKIDNISETFSEYFNGTTGSGGAAGTRPYSDGFAALKSQDSNNDNLFTSADTAYTNVRVWQDADHDGQTGPGELKTLSALNITQINLSAQPESGLVRDGNEVLTSGTFIQGGTTKEALALNFLADPSGHSFITSGTGTKVTTQSGITSYAAGSPSGETIDVTTKGVTNAYGAQGNDTLIGNAGNNWLVGNAGSDTYNAGAGDDVLLIDAADLQTNIHAGAGTDIVQVIGNEGVSLNLAQAEVEVVVGGRGSDVIVSGGNSNTFVRAGEGDDLLIGGSASDALSGENGDDVIDGGAGNDLLRGHRGRDRLIGGAGDDIMEGGQDDDTLAGGAGNDVIRGDQGDDRIDGGDGVDLVKYAGGYADYRITRTEQGTWISDKTGREGTDFLAGVENVSFADVGTISLAQANPMPVDDTVAMASRSGSVVISKAQLLGNDIDYQGDALRISEVLVARGGAASLTAGGDVLFTPDPNFKGVMGFKYKVADSLGNAGLTLRDPVSGATAELRAQVTLKTPDMPDDPYLIEQKYISEVNVLPVWQDYTGKGVRVGVFEPGGEFATGPEVFDYRNPDLAPNVDPTWLAQSNLPTTFSNHTTAVAGVIAAARNGEGTVGVAYDAKIAGQPIASSGSPDLSNMKNFDVVNNSWGSGGRFSSKITPPDGVDPGIGAAITQGRGGLGTVIVFAAGNDRAAGSNTNYDVLTSGPFTITVGATNPSYDGDVSVAATTFSSPGASILVSAPGSYVSSTSRVLTNDNGSTFGDDHAALSGTSFAAPMVSGVVALMLEANPNLGYRDVQDILAISSTTTGTGSSGWRYNGARTWNGGGMHVSHDYGFGRIDAVAAVRLAETWTQQKTAANYITSTQSSGVLNQAIPDGAGMLSKSVTMPAGMEVEFAQVVINIGHARWGDLIVKLISPSGTESVLIDRPGKAPGSAAGVYGDTGAVNLNYALGSTHDRGEQSGGAWTLQVIDAATGQTGILKDWRLTLVGKAVDGNDTYVYTNEFAAVGLGSRATLMDGNGGVDTVNAAAVSTNSTINLNGGGTSTIAGRTLTIAAGTVIEDAIGGDGNDVLMGNNTNNRLKGGRGYDAVYGYDGIDILEDGAGNDTLYGGTNRDYFVIRKDAGCQDVIGDFTPLQMGEKIALVGFDNIQDFSQIALMQEGANLRLNLGDGQSVLLHNISLSQLTEQNIVLLQENPYVGNWLLDRLENDVLLPLVYGGSSLGESYSLPSSQSLFAMGGNDFVDYGTGAHFIDGGDGNDTVLASASTVTGDKWIEGGAGVDRIDGGASNDVIRGGSGNDVLNGYAGNDFIEGGSGDDRVDGGEGNDWLVGGIGNDRLGGASGDDVIILDGDQGQIWRSGGNVVIAGATGGPGSDWFWVMPNPTDAYIGVGDYIYASNLITDFDVNNPNEKIDLSSIDSVSGFEDLTFFETGSLGARVTRINAGGIFVNLFNVPASSLKPSNFEFAKGNSIGGRTGGNDLIAGTAGGNLLDGYAGADVMTGRTGDDVYVVDNAGDMVNELPDGGFDAVLSSITYILPENVENLTLIGAGAIDGVGNDQVNRIVGNDVNNWLDGRAGADTLIGGAGNDRYIVDDTGDKVVERSGGGDVDTVQSSVSFTLPAEVEVLFLDGDQPVNATGNELDNYLYGNVENNALDGAGGADVMLGWYGDDTYLVDNAGDSVVEGFEEGIDTVYAAINYTLPDDVENIILGLGVSTGVGNDSDNVITGNSIANTLTGGAGNDVLDGGAGADTLRGGTGDDTYVVDNAGDMVTEALSEGSDTVEATVSHTLGANVENLVLGGSGNLNGNGNALNNTLIGNSGNNTLTGYAGDDFIDGAAGADTLVGGTGNDIFVVDNAADVVSELASEGTDTVQTGMTYTLGANLENLTLTGLGAINGTGNALNNVLAGNGADNILDGGTGNDALDGGAGNDTYVFGRGYGQDIVSSYDTTAGKLDKVRFAAGVVPADVVPTRASDDLILAINGTADRLTISNYFNSDATGPYRIEQIVFADGTIWDVASVKLKVLVATAGADALYGYATNDTIKGLDGNDYIYGNAGNDTLDGGAGADTLLGGAGNDIYVVDNIGDVVTENAAEGTDTVKAAISYTLGANLENLTLTGNVALNGTGNALNNVLTGNSAVNVLTGGAGNDTLSGGAGADLLLGGIGNDIYVVDNAGDVVTENTAEGTDTVKSSISYTLGANVENLTLTGTIAINGAGNALNNTLTGNSAANTLAGGGGNDVINAGSGNDTLDGGAGNDALNGGSGNDIYIFGRGSEQDTLSDYQTTLNTDILSVTAGVSADQLWFRHVGPDLEVSIIGTNDKATISKWYSGNAYHIEQFKTAGGKTLMDTQVENLVSAMAGFAPPAAGQTTLPASYQTALAPVIAANWS